MVYVLKDEASLSFEPLCSGMELPDFIVVGLYLHLGLGYDTQYFEVFRAGWNTIGSLIAYRNLWRHRASIDRESAFFAKDGAECQPLGLWSHSHAT